MALCLCTVAGRADQSFPAEDWVEGPDPLASEHARRGGTFRVMAGPYPRSFNSYLHNSSTAYGIFGLLYESLLTREPLSMDSAPYLAESWTVSEDKRTFTFHIDPRAHWSDGRPITADDVVWTYETIMDPAHLTGVHKVSLERLNPPEALDERTVRFTAKEAHWGNLLYAGGMQILPRHALEGEDFNRLNFEFPVVSGPYAIDRVSEGTALRLRRRDDWWASDLPRSRGLYNFDVLDLRFFTDNDHAYDVFRRGETDMFMVNTAHVWVNQTSGERFDRNWVVKQSVHNHIPQGFQGWAMNMRREPFNDIRVRKALSHLLDRETMNRTLMHSLYSMTRSYFPDLYNAERPCENPEFPYDPDRARELLREAGWKPNPETGLLEKDGRPFVITFLSNAPFTEKFLNIYREDLLDAGIRLRIENKDWAAWSRDMDEFNYDMTWTAWGAGLYKDPESLWHSREAQRAGGNNITGFEHPEVDRLIEQQREILEPDVRHDIVREIDGILTEHVPYILLWGLDYARVLYWNRLGMPDHVFGKYGNDLSARMFWWADPFAEAELAEAQALGLSLPPRPAHIFFDQVFEHETLRPPEH